MNVECARIGQLTLFIKGPLRRRPVDLELTTTLDLFARFPDNRQHVVLPLLVFRSNFGLHLQLGRWGVGRVLLLLFALISLPKEFGH